MHWSNNLEYREAEVWVLTISNLSLFASTAPTHPPPPPQQKKVQTNNEKIHQVFEMKVKERIKDLQCPYRVHLKHLGGFFSFLFFTADCRDQMKRTQTTIYEKRKKEKT